MEKRVQRILKGIAQSGRVAGAYLFLGPPVAEKMQAAEGFASALKCSKQDKFIIEPGGTSIKIGQIRDLQSWVQYGPSAGKYLVAIVEKADSMTDEAAAAFLKTLEEPPAGVVFILLADREEKLSPTILSRCQRIIFPETEFGRTMQSASGDFCEAMNSIRQKKINELLNLSTGLEKERENIEEVLYDLAYYAHQKLAETRSARIVLDAVRKIKRKANLRLTLDVMCLSLAGVVKNAQ